MPATRSTVIARIPPVDGRKAPRRSGARRPGHAGDALHDPSGGWPMSSVTISAGPETVADGRALVAQHAQGGSAGAPTSRAFPLRLGGDQHAVAVARVVDDRLARLAVGGVVASTPTRLASRKSRSSGVRPPRPSSLGPARQALRLVDHRVLELADPLDLDADDVADLQQPSGNGWRTAPIPAGVPVAITSPGSRVNASERWATCWKQS